MSKILLVLVLFPFLSVAHSNKFCSVYVHFIPESETVNIECRIFGENLYSAVKDEFSKSLTYEPSQYQIKDHILINAFIKKHLKIQFGELVFDLDFDSMDYNSKKDLLSFKYEFKAVKLRAGDKVRISNDIFYAQFPDSQSNVFQLDIPKVVKGTVPLSPDHFSKTYIVKQ